VTYPQVWSNDDVRALPVGHLRDATLRNVSVGRSVAFRAGPWVEVREDDSRLLRVTTTAPILAEAPTATPSIWPVERPTEPAAAELLFDAHPLSRPVHAPESAPATCATVRGPRSRRAWPPALTQAALTADVADTPGTGRAS
jgi:hypothetical protein